MIHSFVEWLQKVWFNLELNDGGGNGRMRGGWEGECCCFGDHLIYWVPPVSCEGNYCFFKMQQSVEIRNLAINFLSFSFIMYFSRFYLALGKNARNTCAIRVLFIISLKNIYVRHFIYFVAQTKRNEPYSSFLF